ncbi:MAG: DUF3293 domain-containing protein [Gammaproteobacteria bacterium]|nr:DUF3293 domain-containing protein [Gammaproteobacteria bacterium]
MSVVRQLEAAYRATEYVVEAPQGTFTLRVGEPSAALALLHAQHGVCVSAYLSAWNPGSVARAAADNAAAHARLLAALAAAGLQGIGGWGRDPSGAWPAERSLLVPGLARPAALVLARQFGQYACLLAGEDAVPRLVWVPR